MPPIPRLPVNNSHSSWSQSDYVGIISANVIRIIAQHAMLFRYFLQASTQLAVLSIDESDSLS